jgi:N6-adenosine-specific RNA methylase IME4
VSSSAELAHLTPKGGFKVIYADPPWKYATRGKQSVGASRLPDRHYVTMKLAEICKLPIGDLAARSSWLFMWTTWPHLVQALQVMKAWGFEYSSNGFTWVKLRRTHAGELMTRRSVHMTTGYTTRKNTEPCLLGRRGQPRRLRADIQEAIFAPVREHSRKPDEAAERIVRYAPGPRLELFAREVRPGFVGWGDELGKFGVQEKRA